MGNETSTPVKHISPAPKAKIATANATSESAFRAKVGKASAVDNPYRRLSSYSGDCKPFVMHSAATFSRKTTHETTGYRCWTSHGGSKRFITHVMAHFGDRDVQISRGELIDTFIEADNLRGRCVMIKHHKFYPDSPGELPEDPLERLTYINFLRDAHDWGAKMYSGLSQMSRYIAALGRYEDGPGALPEWYEDIFDHRRTSFKHGSSAFSDPSLPLDTFEVQNALFLRDLILEENIPATFKVYSGKFKPSEGIKLPHQPWRAQIAAMEIQRLSSALTLPLVPESDKASHAGPPEYIP